MRPVKAALVAWAVLHFASSTTLRAQEASAVKKPVVTVLIDTSDAPEAAGWGEKARAVVQTWYPRVAEMLQSEGYEPPTRVKLVFKKDMKGVAHASGNTITIANDWIQRHPEDLGMVVHEMTHVIQKYPHSPDTPGWLVEGIADYVRFFHYEPGKAIGRFNPDKAKYTDGYRTSARFLAWIEAKHDKDIVKTLNTACRRGEYKPDIFRESTGKSLEGLWDRFVKDAKTQGLKSPS